MAGIDFTLGRFWNLLLTFTGCSDQLVDSSGRKVVCFAMDQSGYIIVHPKFVDGSMFVRYACAVSVEVWLTVTSRRPLDQQSDYFVGQLYPRLAAELVDQGNTILAQRRCNAFETLETHLFYTSETRQVHLLGGHPVMALSCSPCVLYGLHLCRRWMLSLAPSPAAARCGRCLLCPTPTCTSLQSRRRRAWYVRRRCLLLRGVW